MRVISMGIGFLTLMAAAPALAAPDVVVSLKPLHSLVAGVMEGVGEPVLLVQGAASAHTYALRPSDAAALEGADIVFWIGPQMETFLETPLETLAGGAAAYAMMEVDGMDLLPVREGGLFEPHDHDHEGHEHEDHEDDHDDHDHEDEAHEHEEHEHEDQGAVDAHIWLDPRNARLMVAAITDILMTADPENAETYNANGMALSQDLSALDAEIAATLEGVDGAWFAFHDAYHSFEARYGIEATGTFTINPEVAPGAARLIEIREAIAAEGAACIFAEPQFSQNVIDVVASETGARVGVLDPHGADLEPGRDLYFALLRNLAANLADCLTR